MALTPPSFSHQENVRHAYQALPASGHSFGSTHEFYQGSAQEQAYASLNRPLTAEEERKLSIARGEGLHVGSSVPATSGELIWLQNARGEYVPCRRCGRSPVQGLRWFFDNEIRFKCNMCGRHMKMGYTEAAARENQESLQGWDRAQANRRRLWREQDAESQEKLMQDFDETQQSQNPFLSITRDRGFVMQEFFK